MYDSRSPYGPTLFEGTATYYARYRPHYPQELFEFLVRCYHLDGTGRALDLGCGTGQLTFSLVPYFEQVIGMEPDEAMLKTARQLVCAAHVPNVCFKLGSSWELSPAMGQFRLVTMGESFHWMDREQVLFTLHSMIPPGGGVVIVSRKFHASQQHEAAVTKTLEQFLGARRRAGQGYSSHPSERHEVILARSLFAVLEPWHYEYQQDRTIDEIIGFLYSTSYAARRLFGDQAEAFEARLRSALLEVEPRGCFTFRILITALLGVRERG